MTKFTPTRASALTRARAHGDSLRFWLQDRQYAAEKRRADRRKAVAEEPQPSRGTDRVPARYQDAARETQWVHRHDEHPMTPYVNPDRDKKRHARLRTDRGAGTGSLLVGIAVIAAVLASLTFGVVNALHVEQRTCTVEDKDRTTDRDGNSDARVYTEDCGTLHVSDSLLSWTWSSSDTYAAIEPGGSYEVTTRGYRVPFLSMFPNVVEATEVTR